ncbi:hypothetical protein [Leptospira weilii]|uniref:hypothetical protein n=1 Tax=Leptospira weilii TaxID=28184 RepID=UPI000587FB18|nr:hypothetical protein [Leptospira weilii]
MQKPNILKRALFATISSGIFASIAFALAIPSFLSFIADICGVGYGWHGSKEEFSYRDWSM